MERAELGARLRDVAYLEGDFLLRSGKRSPFYLDKYRFSTRPDVLAPIGEALAAAVCEVAPHATRLAGPELG
ncbi:MAG: orotate phosphoribosyltransferase, partial [Gaiellaceae bacterium]